MLSTRVSTKEQVYSLDVRLIEGEEFARKNGYTNWEIFQGMFESAKNDEAKEFNKRLQFAKQLIEKLIHNFSHAWFSRSGPNSPCIK